MNMHVHVVEIQEKHEHVFELLFLDSTKRDIIYSNKTVRLDIRYWVDTACKVDTTISRLT